MCGIVGFYKRDKEVSNGLIEKMVDKIGHRGPDNRGYLSEQNITLGHSRLAIIDLSNAGKQPMISNSGRYVLTCNSEIYNFRDIRKECIRLAYNFSSKGDTEVLLAAIQIWGLEKTLTLIRGMYAFAVWDRKEQVLSLVRDRMGEKPLYYGFNKGDFVFSSELAPIKYFCNNLEINQNSLSLFFRYRYIPYPYSIYNGIYKLGPSQVVSLSSKHLTNGEIPPQKKYWQIDYHKTNISLKEGICQLEDMIKDSIKEQIISDVPVGTFLSGGIDSSLVSAIMQQLYSHPINTFSIGFDDDNFNEAPFAKAVAKHIGSNHCELYVDGKMCLDVIERMPEVYDEPFADESQIPTFLLAKFAKKKVSVCLSGDGADEIFGGYNLYYLTYSAWNKLNKLPRPLRRSFSYLLKKLPLSLIQSLHQTIRPILPSLLDLDNISSKIERLEQAMGEERFSSFYKALRSHHKNPEQFVIGTKSPETIMDTFEHSELGLIEFMMAIDAVTYLPDDILTKVDRACMAVSLESRIPLLDHRIVEFASSLPLDYNVNVRKGIGKNMLRQILYRYVPETLVNRPKKGFSIPASQWFRKELKEITQDLLSSEMIKRQGLINFNYTEKILKDHLSKKRDCPIELWNVLIFQLWMQNAENN